MKRKNIIIVGGGLTGLFAANKLAQKDGLNITLIESEPNCGGLLNSFKSNGGVFYDQGTHLASKTDIKHIDSILFGNESLEKNWYEFSYLNSGNYFSSKWNTSTQVVDIRSLPKEDYKKALAEILTSVTLNQSTDFFEYTCSHVGNYLANELFIPAVNKLYGDDIKLSDMEAKVGYFGLNRVVAFDDDVSEKLKLIPRYDDKLAFSSSQYFVKKMNVNETYLYPKSENGIQFWTDQLLNQAQSLGVQVKTKEQILKMKICDNNVCEVKLKGGETLECDNIIWTAQPYLALKLAGIDYEPKYFPVLRTANLFHFKFNKQLKNRINHYVWNWDKNFKSFRITLYDNFCSKTDAGSRLTLEILSDPKQSEKLNFSEVLAELKDLDLIDDSYETLDRAKQVIHNTFPVPTKQLSAVVNEISELVELTLKNVIFAGRHSSNAWLQTDVIKSIDKKIDELQL